MNDELQKPLWNPDLEDFTVTYADPDNHPIPYTIHAQEIESFPPHIANHIAKHLAQHLVFKRGIKTNYEDEYKRALEEIAIEI